MKDWYELTQNLETETTPLDELSSARILQNVKAALPRRKRKPLLAAVLIAVLLLSACGYVAVTQYSNWFWNLAENPKAPAESEDLLASMGTVINQKQTVDGVTVTLHGALWDGSSLFLSLSLEDGELPERIWSRVETEKSWLIPSRAYMEQQLAQQMSERYPELSEEDVTNMIDKYFEYAPRMIPPEITYLYNEHSNAHMLQIEAERSDIWDSIEMTLHLEDLELPYRVNGSAQTQHISGPFEFTFTVEKKDTKSVYAGEADLESPEGMPIRIQEISLTPLQVEVKYIGLRPLKSDQDGNTIWEDHTFKIKALRVNGEEITGFVNGSAGQRRAEEDGSWDGSISRGPFHRVIDPATVEAVKLNDTWLELSDFTLMESESKN